MDRWAIFQERGEIVVRFYGRFDAGESLQVNYKIVGQGSEGISPWLLGLGIAALVLVAAGAVRRVTPRIRSAVTGRPPVDRTKIEAILPTLTERERQILKAVIDEGGRISQPKLKHISGLPKSSLSRITDELQRKGLIRKIPVGQTNEIRIDDSLVLGGKE